MVKSMNTKVIYTTKANSMTGSIGNKHGDIMVGDKAFEFYNHRYIRGFFIDTKNLGSFNFIVKNAGKCLKEMRTFVGNDNIVRNKPLFSLKKLFRRNK